MRIASRNSSRSRANDHLAERIHRFNFLAGGASRDAWPRRSRCVKTSMLNGAAAHCTCPLAGVERPFLRKLRRTTPPCAPSKRCLPPASRVVARCATRSATSCSVPRREIGSVALVPLGEAGTVGLLALGSAERERFHPGMSTEFLKRMGELITDALARP
jgi:hypothetical protein